LTPPPEGGARSFTLPKSGSVDAPARIANETLLIGSAVLKDGLPEMARNNQEFVEALKGQTLTIKKIYEAAVALEQAYARAGYIFVRVVVPPQRLRDGGVITFGVVNGFIEKVLADKVPAHYRDMVKARLQPLIDRRSITLPEVERCVLLAGDLPGLKLSSALMRGDKAGGVVLIVEGESTFVGGSVTVDNRLPENLGTFQQVTNVYLNNPTGNGERLYATLGSSLGVIASAF
jgi:hemolysin activation/secretion protein